MDEDFPLNQPHPLDSAPTPVRGMESVVATVSGYHGTERFNLIKLISLAGANYVGAMSRAVTHVICWKFEGKKYDLARKFKTIVINHQWIEDSIRQRKRVSERPYTLKSGQEVGSLVMQAPLDFEAGSKKRKALSEQTNSSYNFISTGTVSVSQDGGTDSILLKQKEPFQSSRWWREEKRNHSILKESNLCPSLCLETKENHPNCGDVNSPFAESSRRRRKLVKKNIIRETPAVAPSDSPDDCCIIELGNASDNKTASSNNLDGVGIIEKPATMMTSDTAPSDHPVKPYVSLASIDKIENHNHHVTVEIQQTDQTNSPAKPPATAELSCVICLTEFSPTRGILPCGHRFCFTCIQRWAKDMASSKRISTCPLCKTSFISITIAKDADCSDQKIYSQTIPHAQSAADIYVLPDQQTPSSAFQLYREPVCVKCRSREPADLLISCEVCKTLCIHSYCLDPPLEPWRCIRCKDSRGSHYWAH